MLLRDLQSWESVEIILKQFKTLAGLAELGNLLR